MTKGCNSQKCVCHQSPLHAPNDTGYVFSHYLPPGNLGLTRGPCTSGTDTGVAYESPASEPPISSYVMLLSDAPTFLQYVLPPKST